MLPSGQPVGARSKYICEERKKERETKEKERKGSIHYQRHSFTVEHITGHNKGVQIVFKVTPMKTPATIACCGSTSAFTAPRGLTHRLSTYEPSTVCRTYDTGRPLVLLQIPESLFSLNTRYQYASPNATIQEEKDVIMLAIRTCTR